MLLRSILFLLFNFAALAIGGLFTAGGVKSDWYNLLNKAPWTPPGWVFGFAWSLIMICFAFYISFLWQTSATKNTVLFLYILQWVLNVSWNPVFFKYHQTTVALLIIVALLALVGYMLFYYLQQMHIKSLLIAPYFLWLIIATSLNAYVSLKN